MSDEHKVDWTTADARKRLAEIMQNHRVIVPVELMEAWPKLLGYIEELENLAKANALLENKWSDTISQQAAEIERLKAELADAKSDIAALHGDSEAL